MTSPRLSIVLSDRNWILERLGIELETRLEKVQLNDKPDPSADINYFITFACRKEPASTLEAAFFAHIEQVPELQALFLKTARQVHLPICMSSTYSDLLKANGIDTVLTIPPGVDHTRFQPKLRIGVVGRTYHTGRKGEALIAQLMDMDCIDWHFTGSGWPRPGRHVPDDELPDFYRSMDYILVPSLYEGGPMCVPEALSVGTPVIASAVGWVPRFPHIPFRNGDAADLRRVLEGLMAEKRALHASTCDFTWDKFAEEHDRAFCDLARRHGNAPVSHRRAAAPSFKPVRLCTHGAETWAKGGPTVRVPRTAEALRSIGVPATAGIFKNVEDISEDTVHLFNVWPPQSALSIVRQLKAAGKKVVLSPVYLDLSERPFWNDDLPKLPLDDLAALREAYAAARQHLSGRGRWLEPSPGFHAAIREIFSLVDHVVFLSEIERMSLAAIGAHVSEERMTMIRNPVDAHLWSRTDPSLFREAYIDSLPGPQEFVLCVARLEARKNQLLLARAMREMDLRLVLVGHVGHDAYVDLIRKEAGDRLVMTGRLEHGSAMHRSALAACSVFALPSWAEGASLSALEAGAMGCSMVLSDRSSEREYFGDLACYCDPSDPASIRAAIEQALAAKQDGIREKQLKALVADQYGYGPYAKATAQAYRRAIRSAPVATARAALEKKPKLVLDVTTLAHHSGRITGISRVESMIASELIAAEREATFITWSNERGEFIEVPPRYVRLGDASQFRLNAVDCHDIKKAELPRDCTIVVPGSAWMQNRKYIQGLETLKASFDCSIVSVIYDLIPFKFPFWFADNYAPVFVGNFKHLASISDHIVTDSQCCAGDVREVLAQFGLDLPISTLRLGDPVLSVNPQSAEAPAPDGIPPFLARARFVLAVGAIHARKNYDMLYRVWARFADHRKHQDLHLVIAGGVAWNGQSLADTMARDTRVSGKIHVLADLSDADLAWLYERCLFTAFPSHYEGWGLPVSESLAKGKLCLATSSSSVTEIASDLVEHIDPEDFVSWHHRISFYSGSRSALEAKEGLIRSRYRPVPWSATVDQLLDVVGKRRKVTRLRPLLEGEVATASRSAIPLQLGFDSSWHLPEDWGRWSSESDACLQINVSRSNGRKRPCLVVLHLVGFFANAKQRKRFTVSAHGVSLFSAVCMNDSFPRTLILRILPELIGEDGTVRLDLSFPTSTETAQTQRWLGVGVRSLVLLDPTYANPLHFVEDHANWIDGTRASHLDFSILRHREVLAPHLAYSAGWGVGPNNGMASFNMPILPSAPAQDVEVHFRAVATPGRPVSVVAYWNGIEKQRALVTTELADPLRFRVGKPDLEAASPAILVIETSSLLSPAKAGLGAAPDICGIGVTDIFLRPAEGCER